VRKFLILFVIVCVATMATKKVFRREMTEEEKDLAARQKLVFWSA